MLDLIIFSYKLTTNVQLLTKNAYNTLQIILTITSLTICKAFR